MVCGRATRYGLASVGALLDEIEWPEDITLEIGLPRERLDQIVRAEFESVLIRPLDVAFRTDRRPEPSTSVVGVLRMIDAKVVFLRHPDHWLVQMSHPIRRNESDRLHRRYPRIRPQPWPDDEPDEAFAWRVFGLPELGVLREFLGHRLRAFGPSIRPATVRELVELGLLDGMLYVDPVPPEDTNLYYLF